MNKSIRHFRVISAPRLLLAAAVILLSFEPVLWLVRTWHDPSYDSDGFIIFAFCIALFAWSVSSARNTLRPVRKNYALGLLAITALIRFCSQFLAINVIGALALVVDVYAIAYLTALHLRKRAISPFWLAACFAFCLPLERIIQRSIGYGLQHISADAACTLLGSIFDRIACNGVRILVAGQDVLVDLPCSGARSLLLLLFFFCAASAICRSSLKASIAGVMIVLVTGLLTNALRITLLAIGVAMPGYINVMEQPWHDIIGLLTLALACLPILFWARLSYTPIKRNRPAAEQIRWIVPKSVAKDGWWLQDRPKRYNPALIAAACFLTLSITIIAQPRTARDVAPRSFNVSLPSSLLHETAQPMPLLDKEKAYFTQFGGAAAKAQYGAYNLMLVRTSSPLRHLHAPDECLRGLGFDVTYLGVRYRPIPTAIYKATDTQGNTYRIAVTFLSDDGRSTTNISEAVWRWLQKPGLAWTAIQRISPWDMPGTETEAFDHAVMTAFDIPLNPDFFQLASTKE